MSYLFYAILSALTFAVVNICDKFIIDKVVTSPRIMVLNLGIIGTIFCMIIISFKGIPILNTRFFFFAIMSGLFYSYFIYLYFTAAKIQEITTIIAILYLNPLVVLLFSSIFLNESFNALTYIGILLLVSGAFLISFDFSRFTLKQGILYALFASFFMGVSYVINKYLLEFADFWTVFAFSRLGTGIFALIMLSVSYNPIVAKIKKIRFKLLAPVGVEILALLALLFFTIASSLGPISIVSAILSLQPLFLFLLTIPISLLYPVILKENLNTKVILIKGLAIFLMCTGLVMIS